MKITSHRISIPTILEVGKGNIGNIGSLIKKNDLTKVVLLFGEGLVNLFGGNILASLQESNINVLYKSEIEDVNMDQIVKAAFSFSSETEAIIGVGGGKVLDAAKYMSFLRKIPFIAVPTSTSNDGFSSSGASLIIDGKRTSVLAKMPFGIIVDIDIIKSAPEKFIFSGIGDLVSNITALYDWKFEEANGKAKVDDFAVMISKKAVNSFIRTEFNSIRDDLFLKELVDSLTMNGVAMEIAGDSAPASGSEHLISHALDRINTKMQLHGIQVGLATYIMSKIQHHRNERITTVFKTTGFFDYVKTLGMRKIDFEKAIDIAPSIKPSRYTYIHIDEHRAEAKKLIYSDEILKNLLL